MNARAIAEEVVLWYQANLDPNRPHVSNVRRNLQGPVLWLTHGVLTGLDKKEEAKRTSSADCVEDEKKCESTGFPLVSTGGGLLDKFQWKLPVNSMEDHELCRSLGRRDKARLEAFLTGVELAVPSELERCTSSRSSSSSSSQAATPLKKQQQPFEQASSPVLTSLNQHGKALLRSVSVDSTVARKQPQIRLDGLKIRLELYLRSLYRVRSLGRDCVVAVEPDRAIQARATMFMASFISTVGCVRSMSPVLTRLLTNLTKELLAVDFVGETLLKVIHRIVSEYEHGTSFASLAFLSSPEASAEARLTPMILKFIRYLQSDWKAHEQACELERMLACSLDGHMRRYLKTVEFQSIGHLLEVCQGFRSELMAIELTPTPSDLLCHDPDAVRQAILDLQREVITINGHVLPPVTSRTDLIRLLSQSLNSRTLTAAQNKNNHEMGRSESCPSFISTEPASSYDTDTDVSDSPGRSNFWRTSSRRASFHVSTVDLLTRRLLIAASRTGTGGDAYFIVRDLFGDDEDVEVVPAKVLPHHVRATRVGSLEIQVRLASVTIKCHGSFDIYPKSLLGCCEPLIQLHTTSSETIYLQELRSCDSSSEDGRQQCLEDDGSRSSDGVDNLVLQEKKTNKTGRRMLSIRPALYEKVQVWNTPS